MKPKIAIVHDYLREFGGAERVLEVLHQLYPEAPVFVAFVDQAALGPHWKNFADWDIRSTWLARVPLIKKLFSPLRLFAPLAFKSLDLRAYDVVISSTNAYFAKAVTVHPGAVHVCYCHTPARSLYGYTTMTDWKKKPIIRFFGEVINHYLRIVDLEVARNNVDQFIANSAETARRIKKFYRLDSQIIFPPCEVPDVAPEVESAERQHYLYVNRLAFAKHPEMAIEAANELKLPLKVVGSGPLFESLSAQAGPTVQMLGAVTDQELAKLYAGARAVLYPVEDEDFGMVPIEAMGHGTPVIAHRSGGPRETIVDGQTGIFFDELSVSGLVAAIQKFQTMSWSAKKIWHHAQRFNRPAFEAGINEVVARAAKA